MQTLGIGTDITECGRIEKMLAKHGDSFLERVYTEAELAYCSAHKQHIERYAGRWAAKEAVLKALGTGWIRGIRWRDVEVLNEPSGRPVVTLHGGALLESRKQGISRVLVSISHCSCHAVAFAVALGEAEEEGES